MNRPQEPPLGAGEASATPVPAALANAVFDAVGARLTTVPFTRERVRAALGRSSKQLKQVAAAKSVSMRPGRRILGLRCAALRVPA